MVQQGTIDEFLNTIEGLLREIYGEAAKGIGSLFADIDDQVTALDGVVQVYADSEIDVPARQVSFLFDGVIKTLEDVLSDTEALRRRLATRTVNMANSAAREGRALRRRLEAQIRESVEREVQEDESIAERIAGTVGGWFGGAVEEGQSILGRIAGAVRESLADDLSSLSERVSELSEGIPESIQGVIDGALDVAKTALAAVEGYAVEGWQMLASKLPEMVEAFSGMRKEAIERFERNMSLQFGVAPGDDLQEILRDRLGGLIERWENDPDVPAEVKTAFSPGFLQAPVAMIFAPLIIGMALGPVLSQAMAGEAQAMQQASFRRLPNTVLSPAAIQEAMRRGEISDWSPGADLEAQGYDAPRANALAAHSFFKLPADQVLSLWLRGELHRGDVDDRLQEAGFVDAEADELKRLAYRLPPIPDIIQFAVREVFDVPLAERFGQFEGLDRAQVEEFRQAFEEFGTGPEASVNAFRELSKRVGMEPKWAAAYWGSHWVIPGVQDLFTMQHRLAPDMVEADPSKLDALGISADDATFTRDDLQATIRAKDFTRFWRERLRAISYRTLSRVDVRRIHRLGLIDRERVKREYRRQGYDPDDAELMTRFTEAYNAAPEPEEAEETRQLTRAQVRNFYRAGILNRELFILYLQKLGYSDPHAVALASLEDMEARQERRDRDIKIVRAKYENGVMSFNEAVAALDSLNLPSRLRDETMLDMEAERLSRIRLPSRSELDAFAKQGIISRDEYVTNLVRLGYPEPWPERFAQLNVSVKEE